MAKEFGWTLDYIRSLSFKDWDMIGSMLKVSHKIRSQGKEKLE
jgi:hypothetical protein